MPKTPDADKEEPWRRVAAAHPETALPGYWPNIADNAQQWANEITAGPFWNAAGKQLDQWRTAYKTDTGADLLIQPGLPAFSGKPEASIRSKVLRGLQAKPVEAEIYRKEGPPVPVIKDLVRTRVVCRYIDGVEYLADKLAALADKMSLQPARTREGRVDGYFAQHLVFQQDVFYRLAGHAAPIKIFCEVQLATELASRMWEASHPFYEFARERTDAPETWQWKPGDPRFIANQLGHMIHLADGLLVNLRSATRRKSGQ